MERIDLAEKLAAIDQHWTPKIVATLNDQDLKLAKLKGEFPWHKHDETDELFLAVTGTFKIEFRDRVVTLEPGQMVVVPKGTEHRPVADEECGVLIAEIAGTVNTGDAEASSFTAPVGVRI